MIGSISRPEWLKIKRTRDLGPLEGRCPECKEYTTAGESCCGRGAIVEGSLITDERVQEARDEESE